MMYNPEEFLERGEAATVLKISLRTLDRLIASKEIAVRRVGRRVFVTRSSLNHFMRCDHKTTVRCERSKDLQSSSRGNQGQSRANSHNR
jgi:excisionase family DNA binding protein